MDNKGWIKINRNIQDSWLWNDPVRLRWWIDILLTVNYEPKKVIIGFKEFTCERGQSLLSLSGWAKRWNVSKSVVNNFLNSLQKRNAIHYANETVTIRLTVCNYDTYQIDQNANDTQTKRKRQPTKEYKEKKNKEINNNISLLPENENYVKFKKWLVENAPNVLKIRDQITENEFLTLKEKYTSLQIQAKLNSLDNKAGAENKYNSVYKTISNWLSKDSKANESKGVKSESSQFEEIFNGKRTYVRGKTRFDIPEDAPNRPSNNHSWSEVLKQWVYLV